MTNPYLDMLQAGQGAPAGGTDTPANPYLDLMQQADDMRRQQMAGQLSQAVGTNPEQYSTQRRVAQYLGYPTAVVEAVPSLAETAKVKQIQQDSANAPTLQRKYTDADFAKLAHDDSFTLAGIESAAISAAKYVFSHPDSPGGGLMGDAKRGVYDNSVIGAAGAFRMASDLAAESSEIVIPQMKDLEASGQYGGNPLRRLAEGFAQIAETQTAIKKASTPQSDGNFEAGIHSGVESGAQNAKYIPLAFFGPPGWAAALAGMVAETGGMTYEQDREKGIGVGTASIHAGADMLAEYVGERYFGEVGFLERLASGSSAAKLMAYELSREVPGEIGTTLWQNFNDWALTEPNKSVADFLREQPDAIVQTAIATLVGGAVQTGTGKAVTNMVERALNTGGEIGDALQREESLKQLFTLAAQSKLAERSPEQLKVFVDEASGNAMARFDAAKLVEVFNQAGVPLDKALPSVPLQDLRDMAATGGEVSVPLGELVTGTRGTGLEQTILEHARLGRNSMSAAEARDAQTTFEQTIKQDAERVIAQAQDQAAAQADHDAVKQTMLDQLNAAGRHSPTVNDGLATWASAFYTTMAARNGMTAQEMYQRFPLRVLAEASQGGQAVMDQPGTPAFDNWFGDSKVVDAEGKPLVVYHGTTADFSAFDTSREGGVGEVGTFFTTDPAEASSYGHSEGANVVPAHLAISNPYVVTDRQWVAREGLTPIEARDAGYDGYVIEQRNGTKHFIAFRPEQIKSAIGNRGTYDPNDPNVVNQSAYHGTPHRGIEKFSTDKIGTGEGAQAYGWGLYFASKREIAEHYRETITGDGFLVADGKVFDPSSLQHLNVRGIARRGDLDAAISKAKSIAASDSPVAAMAARDLAVLEDVKARGGISKNPGQLYEVDIPEDSEMLHWDKPLSEQPAAVREALAELDPEMYDPSGDDYDDAEMGQMIYQRLQSKLGSDRAASEYLAAAGIKGIKYLDGTSRGAGEGSYNYVVFSGDDVAIKNQFYQRTANTGPRGTFNPKTLELVLNPNADLSTFFHETGHFFLEVMGDLASQPGAPAQIADDMGKILAWFASMDGNTMLSNVERDATLAENRAKESGKPEDIAYARAVRAAYDHAVANGGADYMVQVAGSMGRDVPDAHRIHLIRQFHERWAESIEQYVMEGKAPSVELQGPMRRFAAWLKSVYGSIKKFLAQRDGAEAQPLNDDIRRVMDRMLATDEQIAQANHAAGMAPNEEADAEAAERLNKRSMADLKWAVKARDKVIAKLKREARSIEKAIRAEAVEEVNRMPEFQAADALAKAGAEYEANPTSADFNAAVIADSFGYPSVEAMHRAIDTAGSKADMVDSITQRRMLEEHGDLVDEDAIKQAANEAVHNGARARSLATELRTQREMLNPRQDTGEVNAAGSKITVNALTAAAKQFGEQVVARTSLADLRNRGWQHTAAERRAAKRWAEATAAGKTDEAVKAKQDQLLNNAAAKAALEARQEAQKILDFFKRVTKGNSEEVVDKGRDANVVNAARAVLAAYGVQTATTKKAGDYLDALSKHDPETFNVIKPMVDGALQNAQPLDALTVEQLRSLNEDIGAMWHLAKRMRQMEVAGDLIDIQEAADEVHARMVEIGIPDTVPGEAGAVTKAEERARWLQFARALLSRVEQWTERMDGKWGGPFTRFVFQPIKQAADVYRTDRSAYRAKFQALVDNVAPALKPGLIEAPELGYTFGRGHNGIGHAELLHAILHTGNESNKRKLLLGRQWATENADGTLDTGKWDSFITRLINAGVLTKAHYDFAQGVWDLLEETKPLAQKAHRDVFGRYFDEVTADAFVTPFGTYRGGYVPAQADPTIVSDADLRALAEMENESMAFSFPTTSKGFTKSRVEYNRPLKLDLRTIPQHLDKVLLFSHMEPAVRGVARLLRQKGVSQAMNRIDPAAYSGMLLPWLNRSARQQVETPIMGDGRVSRVLSALRSRAGAAVMFANVSNAVQQITGFSNALVLVKGSHIMNGVAQMIAHPKQTRAAVAKASPFMAERMDNEVAQMTDAMNDILLDPSLYEKAQAWGMRHSYFLQSALDNAMGPMIWTGAYNQALAEGQSDTDAVAFADGVIRKTQGSTLPEDISRMETGPAYARLFTQFTGYFNMMANTNGTALAQIAGEMGLKKGAGKALGVVFYGMLAPIWIAEAIAQAFKGGPDDPDGDGYLDDWLAAVFGMGTIKGMLAQVPFIAQLGQVVVNRFNKNPADDRFSLSPAVSLLESAASVPYDVYKGITDGENSQRLVRDSAALVSLATGLPATAAARPLGYIAAQSDGKVSPTSAPDAVRGLVTGVASPESKNR